MLRLSTRKRLPFSKWAALWLVLASVTGAGCRSDLPSHPAIGRRVGRLPLVALTDPSLPQVGTAEPTFTGKVTLLNFWGTWCMPCRRELPGLARLAKRLESEPDFQLLAISCSSGGPDDLAEIAASTSDFLTHQRLALNVWADPDGVVRMLFSESLGLEAYPTTYLIGPDARVQAVWVGYRSRDEADIARSILAALNGLTALKQSTAQEEVDGSGTLPSRLSR